MESMVNGGWVKLYRIKIEVYMAAVFTGTEGCSYNHSAAG